MALVFLKLGGSLVTKKSQPYTTRPEIIKIAAQQIKSAIEDNEELALLIGHGSGSFGHFTASKYNTRMGVNGSTAWQGFSEVWYQASSLNRIIIDAFRQVNLPVVTVSPFSCITVEKSKKICWNLASLKLALKHKLIPVIHGDVVFDSSQGGTILSTEELFSFLAQRLRPSNICLAGQEPGVWDDFSTKKQLIEEITPVDFSSQSILFGDAAGKDITGGMQSKVSSMIDLVQNIKNCKVQIFSGEKQGNIYKVLMGEEIGTIIHS